MQVKVVIKTALLLFFLVIIAVFVADNRADFYGLISYSSVHLVAVVTLYIVFFSINALILMVSVKDYSYSCDFLWSMKVCALSSLFSYASLLKAGTVGYKVYSIISVCRASLKDALGVVAIAAYFSILANGALVVVGLWITDIVAASYLFLLAVCVAGFGVLPYVWSEVLKAAPLLKRFNDFFLRFRVSSVKVYCIYVALFFAQLLIGSMITYVLFRGLNQSISFPLCLLISGISGLSLIVALTPGNIGVREALFVVLGGALDIDGSVMLAVSVIDRCIQFAILALILCAVVLLRKFKF